LRQVKRRTQKLPDDAERRAVGTLVSAVAREVGRMRRIVRKWGEVVALCAIAE